MTDRLAGKVAVVVGAGQTPGETMGNGRATAIAFAREGAQVVLVDRRQDSADETAAMIEAEGIKTTALTLAADIASAGGPESVRDATVAAFGRIDILHNNVGIGAGDGKLVNLEPDAWDRIMNVNLRAMWLTCKAVVPVMVEQRSGSVINISSIASIAAATTLSAYKISKAGVNAMTQSLAMAHARKGVRVNAILPGFIDTPMGVDAPAQATGIDRADYAKVRADHVPLGRQGTAWDVANAAVFLASDEAAFITGVLLAVDGGQTVMIG
jgi:NAD(P)-dependent dehydrogenase (short-subunit alcohol dehydrogenase family)